MPDLIYVSVTVSNWAELYTVRGVIRRVVTEKRKDYMENIAERLYRHLTQYYMVERVDVRLMFNRHVVTIRS